VRVVFQFLAECVGEPREPPHAHPHREVSPLRIGRADVPQMGRSCGPVRACAVAVLKDWIALRP
jgi:hypothetical protein